MCKEKRLFGFISAVQDGQMLSELPSNRNPGLNLWWDFILTS